MFCTKKFYIDIAWRACRPQGVNTDLYKEKIKNFLEALKSNKTLDSYKINEVADDWIFPHAIPRTGGTILQDKEQFEFIYQSIIQIFESLQKIDLIEQDEMWKESKACALK